MNNAISSILVEKNEYGYQVTYSGDNCYLRIGGYPTEIEAILAMIRVLKGLAN